MSIETTSQPIPLIRSTLAFRGINETQVWA